MHEGKCFWCDRLILTEMRNCDVICGECSDFMNLQASYRDDPLDSVSYQSYLQGGHWQQIRDIKIEHANGKCAVCSSTLLLHVHHRQYPTKRIDITPSMLVVLCKRCHEATHG